MKSFFKIVLAFLAMGVLSNTAQADITYVAKWGFYGSGDGQFNYPAGVAADSSGNLYVADTRNNRIQKFTNTGQFVSKWGSTGSMDGQFSSPYGIAMDSSSNLYVADTANHRIQKFSSSGQFITKWGFYGSGDGRFSNPASITADSSDNVYVADSSNNRIQKFNSSGQFITKWGSVGSGDGQFNNPIGVTTDSSGNVYVADYNNNRIQKFTNTGQFVTKWGSVGSGDGQFNAPRGVAVDSNGNLYVAGYGDHRIQKFTSSGQFVTKLGSTSGSGNGQFNNPIGVVVDSASNLYIADSNNNRIQKLATIFSCNNVTEIPVAECQELVSLYNSTDGANWVNKTGWNQTNTPCSWFGVTCTSGRITKIDLTGNGLKNSLPNLNLSELTWLGLDNNQLNGSVPNFNLLKLQALGLGGTNQFSGTIPDFNLPNLQYLALDKNQLSGSIPNFNLPKLIALQLNGNKLSGTIPNFTAFNLANLSYAYFNNNCGLAAYDSAQETVLNGKDPDWKTRNPICPVSSYNLTLNKTGNGIITGDGNYAVGSTVNLIATPDANYTFTGWSPSPCANSFVMPANALTCTATFALKQFDLTVSKTGNGTVNSGGTYVVGATVNLTATPDAGWTFTNWSPSPCANSFVIPANALTCTAIFEKRRYVVTATALTGGSISPASLQVEHGNTTTFSITPANNFIIDSVSGCNGILSGTTYTTGVITGDCETKATFKAISYSLNVNSNGNGQVSGNGIFPVNTMVNLTATPNTGYKFVSWSPAPCASSFAMSNSALTCNATFEKLPPDQFALTVSKTGNGQISSGGSFAAGSTVNLTATPDANSTFTGWSPSPCANSFVMPNNALTCTANFAPKGYSITTQSNNGKIEPVSLSLEQGKTAQFTLTPDVGYEVENVQGCGAGIISPQRNSYAIPAISSDCQINATFKRKTYSVTFSVSPANGGSVGISSPVVIQYGGSATFAVTPTSGYEFGGISGCNAVLQSGNTYTTGIITDTCNIAVNFIIKGQLSITTKTNGNGSIDPQGKSLDKGTTAIFSLIPKTGYDIESVSGCNGARNIENNTFTTGAVDANCEITANFKVKQLTVTTKISTDKGGSIDPMFSQVEYGKSVKFTLKPDIGYEIDRVEGCGGHFQDNQFTTGIIETACEITAYFKLKQWTVTSSVSGTGGSITPPSQSVKHGKNTQFTLTPNIGYEIAKVESGCNGSQKEMTYTTNEITADCSVIASFRVKGYSIQSAVRPKNAGSIQLASNSVEHGKTVDFSIAPTEGYELELVRGCSSENIVPTNGIYTTRPMTGDCILSADFISKKYEVKLTYQYSNKPSRVAYLDPVEHGQSTGFDFPPNDEIDSATGCNGNLNLKDNHYTTGTITAPCEIVIYYKSIISQCTTFNLLIHPQVYVPCVKVGNNVYEAGMNLIATSPTMRFEVDMNTLKFTQLIPTEQCAVFSAPNTSDYLRINCLDVGDKYWVDLKLVNTPNVIQFDLVDFGKY